jgi:hypothetical protein
MPNIELWHSRCKCAKYDASSQLKMKFSAIKHFRSEKFQEMHILSSLCRHVQTGFYEIRWQIIRTKIFRNIYISGGLGQQ